MTKIFNLFIKTRLLVDKNELKTKLSSYDELGDYLLKRVKDYQYRFVSLERLEEITFKFRRSTENFKDQKSCNICMDDYVKDQEFCHLPCNHFACRKCIETWFREKFQCSFVVMTALDCIRFL